MYEFCSLKYFSINYHAPKAPIIIQVNWQKPDCDWTKCNNDGSSRGYYGLSTIGAIYKDSSGAIVGCFLNYLGVTTFFLC